MPIPRFGEYAADIAEAHAAIAAERPTFCLAAATEILNRNPENFTFQSMISTATGIAAVYHCKLDDRKYIVEVRPA